MNDNLTNVRIEELQQTESGMLTGGFVALESPECSGSLINKNCSDSSGVYNGNCGCNKCNSSSNENEIEDGSGVVK